MPDRSTYKQVLKATSIFGGVQVFGILISILRSKAIALLVGPAGVGIAGLFNGVLSLMGVLSGIGLETSAVKRISAAGDDDLVREVSVLQRMVWITGCAGALACAVCSPILSRVTFGNQDYTIGFIWLGLAVLLKQLTVGQLALLQGLRKISGLARANMWGSFLGLLFTVPMYYWFGIRAIVPAILVSLLIAYGCNAFYASRVRVRRLDLTWSQTFVHAKPMVKLGLSLSFISVLTTLTAYVLQVYISHTGGLAQVGLFAAGFAILNSYVGMVFNAMATDYFPRLSAICHDPVQLRSAVGQQAFVAVLIMTPVIVIFLACAPLVVSVLYSDSFLPVVGLLRWGVLGMLFKAVSWAIGYVLIARNDSRLFMTTSIVFNSAFLALNIAGYHYYGLEGLGMTMLFNYFVHLAVLSVIARARYSVFFDREFLKIYLVCVLLCAGGFLFTYIANPYLKAGLMALTALLSLMFSLYQINKKIRLTDTIKNLKTKWKR